MMTSIRRTLLVILLACSAALAGDDSYTNDFHGIQFSIPKGATRSAHIGKGQLANWVKLEEGADGSKLTWSLSLHQNFNEKENVSLTQLGLQLAERVRRLPGGKVTDKSIATLGEHKVLLLEGVTKPGQHTLLDESGNVISQTSASNVKTMHFRQAWIELKPKSGMFLTIKLDAVEGQSIQTLWDTVWKSILKKDPSAFHAQLKVQTKNASTFLESLQTKTIHAALPEGPQWILLSKNGKPIGWRCLHAKTCIRGYNKQMYALDSGRKGTKGTRFRTWSYMCPPDKEQTQASVSRSLSFLADSSDVEHWQSITQNGLEKKKTDVPTASIVNSLEGLRQNNMIVSILSQGGRPKTYEHPVDIAIRAFYLPRTLDPILPKLLDRTKGRSYTFACYNVNNEAFAMRTLTIVGPEMISLSTGRTHAIKITDQPDMGAPRNTLWVDPATGTLLRATSGTMEILACDQRAILAKFPDALAVIKTLNDAETAGTKKP
ncbi:MAG: hypothetical protein HN909_02195 [Phycisphaerales bacterium]|jgi:hypothetical protein|nr:hypothetical protein [Phycisphaerales bacterium]MBT7170561.1 hypothetical protein [Phycisphaerales bacterium]